MTGTERGAYAKSALVKRSILEACVTAFGESGFHGATMAEVARRAGISHTGLLHHFPTKQALLTAVLTMQDARAARILAGHGDVPHADPLVIVRGLLESLTDRRGRLAEVELSAVLAAEAVSERHPGHTHFRDRYDGVRTFLTRQFAVLQQQHRLIGGAEPAILAAITVAVVEGLHVQWMYDHDAIDIDTAIVTTLGAFVPELVPVQASQTGA
jgi:AcrR family transcriptional regulator